MTSQRKTIDIATFLLYSFGFLLLWEWLRPLQQLTDTGNMFIFLLFMIIAFLLSYLHVRPLVGTVIKSLYVLFALRYLYYEGSFFQIGWLSLFSRDLQESFGYLVAGDWSKLGGMFRSFLFYVLLWMMTYLIHYWLINRRRIFIFFIMTLVYITVLDTFTPYVAEDATVRTVIVGFAAMGMLTFYRLLETERLTKQFSFSQMWMTPLAVMILVSVAAGFAVPKAAPLWPDPVPFIQSYGRASGTEAGGAIQRIGYGADDSRLGGALYRG